MTGYIGLAVLLAWGAPLAAHAQGMTPAQRDSAMVLDHSFNAPVGEPVRVFLAKGVKYRAVVSGDGIQLVLRSVAGSVQQPLIEPFMAGESAAHETVYNITPRADAEYEFVTNGGTAGTSVSLHVYAVKTPKQKP
jgi:hypothetical protein